jgi:hypothetical protein
VIRFLFVNKFDDRKNKRNGGGRGIRGIREKEERGALVQENKSWTWNNGRYISHLSIPVMKYLNQLTYK